MLLLKIFVPLFLISVVIFFLIFKFNFLSSQLFSPNSKGLNLFKNSPSQDSHLPSPTLESIFSSDHTWTATLSAQKKITLIATGDVIPTRSVNYQSTIKNDFLWPYRNIASLVSNGDLTFINLETPLIKNCPITQTGMIFCGSDKHIEGLKLMGVDVASLANNHSTNHGKAGINETTKLLADNGVEVTGINGPVFKEVKRIKFAFLGFNDIEPKPDYISIALEDNIRKQIAKAKNQADVVIVTYHWGTEYQAQPDQRQKELGYLTINAGADLVIGNHPHWIQPIEFYQGKLITYAHGNTIFDQEWSQKTKEGVIGKYTFFEGKLVDVEYFPIGLKDYGEAFIQDEKKSQRILEDMKQNSILML